MKKPNSNTPRRPVHKVGVKHRLEQAELNRKHPEPMSLFHKREKAGVIPDEIAAKISMLRGGKVYCQPEVTPGDIMKAASAAAAWDNSDPFAYGRTALHVSQGYLHSDEIVKEMTQRTLARQAAKRKEVDDAKSHV